MRNKPIKNLFLTLSSIFLLTVFSYSCTERPSVKGMDVVYDLGIIKVELPKDTTIYLLPGEKCSFNYKIAKGQITTDGLPNGWVVKNKPTDVAGSIEVTAPNGDHLSNNYSCDLILGSTDEKVAQKETVKIRVVDLTARGGTYVYNEGNMSNETGSVCYITPEGMLVDNLYERVNGSKIGNVCQDMFISNGKAYIMSQNGVTGKGEDGMLIVVDAKSFKKVKAFTNEEIKTPGINMPKFVATLDGRTIYIKDYKKVWKYDAEAKTAEAIDDISKAQGIPFVEVDGKYYYALTNSIREIDPQTNTVRTLPLPTTGVLQINKVIDLLPAGDGKLWIVGRQDDGMTFGLFKYNLRNHGDQNTPLPCNILPNFRPGWSNYHQIAVSNDEIYYYVKTKIYKLHFDANARPTSQTDDDGITVWSNTPEAQEYKELTTLNENAKMIYNSFAVNPVTNKLYIYTLKGWGQDYKVRSILGLDLASDKYSEYKNVFGAFSAGLWFNK